MATTEIDTLAQRVTDDPTLIFKGEVAVSDLLTELRQEAEGVGVDMTKPKSRAALTSAAYRISRIKTSIDDAGKSMTDEWRKKTNKVNEVRKKVRDGCDALRDEIRMPLQQWEDQEQARVDSAEAIIKSISEAGIVTMEDTAGSIGERIARLKAMDLSEGELQEFAERAQAKRFASIEYLASALARAEKAEAEAAELEKLRKAAAEREERDRQEAEAREAKEREERLAREKAEREAREAEERRQREAEIAKQAEARAKEDAERRVREAEEAAAREREELSRNHQEELRRREEEAARQEAERRAAEEARAAEARRREQEEEARARDAAHRESVKAEAAAALTRVPGVNGALASKIVTAICAGDVPNVLIKF